MSEKQTEFDSFRLIYLENLNRSEYPILPAFYYYLNHTSNKDLLSQNDFQQMFLKGVTDSIHPISLEHNYAEMDIEEIFRLLTIYYDVRELYNKEGELIGLI